MPKVHLRKSQGRSVEPMRCTDCSSPIVKGEEYYGWSIKAQRGGVTYYKHKHHGPPRQSQLTNSRLNDVYAAVEGAESAIAGANSVEEIHEALNECYDAIEQCRDKFQESFDNMPEGLQQGDTGHLLEERVQALEDFLQELDSARDNLPEEDNEEADAEEESDGTKDDVLQEARSAAEEAVASLSI